MAAGVVSGAVADLLQAQPKLTPDQVKARLIGTNATLETEYPSDTSRLPGATMSGFTKWSKEVGPFEL